MNQSKQLKPKHDQKPTRMPILAVDFDGTLVEDAYPNIGAWNEDLVYTLKVLKSLGVRLILWTSRTKNPLLEAVAACAHKGLEFDTVNANLPEVIEDFGDDPRKVFATLYLDDRSVLAGQIVWTWLDRLGVDMNAYRESYRKLDFGVSE